MLDGVHVAEHVLWLAGIDEQGYKHVLGMREGALKMQSPAVNFCVICASARNADRAQSARGSRRQQGTSARLYCEVFGERALIQRCRVHKESETSPSRFP